MQYVLTLYYALMVFCTSVLLIQCDIEYSWNDEIISVLKSLTSIVHTFYGYATRNVLKFIQLWN